MKRVLALAISLVAGVVTVVSAPAGAETLPGVGALWPESVVPDEPNWPDPHPVEVGVRFVSSEAVDIVGVRFYKGEQNVVSDEYGHIGSLWSANGDLLARATFVNETASGWQDVEFDSPVAIEPGTHYIASYYVPVGYYAAVNDYFGDDLTVGPITALGGLNGVYSYGGAPNYGGDDSPGPAFPEFVYRTSNYWVTPLWSVNRAPEADAGTDTFGDEGSAISLTGSASDADGDALTTTWSVVSGPDDGGSCSFAQPNSLSTTMTCTDDGMVVVQLSVSDGIADPVTDTVAVDVANVAPTVSASTGSGEPVSINTVISLTTTVTDPGSNDSVTCTVDWGDGSSDSGRSCAMFKAYAAAGVYKVDVTATDDDGGVGTATTNVVVYDPSAGFVTGGGWFDSPAGAYALNPSAHGFAWFGFVSKYQKGAAVPTGATTFGFRTAGLKFLSRDYDWLVVTGSDFAKFKGTGSVNGEGGYTFQIWAGDGKPDTFRIKIWEDTAAGEVVLYDNGSQQPISSGQIKVHAR